MSGEAFGPLFDDFRASRPGRMRVSDETLATLREELEDFDVQRIAAGVGGSISVWFDKDGDGQVRSVELPAVDAMEFYEAGFQIYIRAIDSPTLAMWRRDFHEHLGLSDRFTCDLFATKKPHVAACHFDHGENFTLQLTGSKVWRLSPNRSVYLPTAALGDASLYTTAPFPQALPDDAQEYALEPGHLLYTPRGYWHEVTGASQDPTLSLLISYTALTWADLIAPALRSLLLRKEAWRMNAHGGGEGSAARASQFRQMIAEAAAELRALEPRFLFERGKCPRERRDIRRNPLATMSIYPADAHQVRLVATVHIGEHSRSYEAVVPAHWQRALEQLLGQDRPSLQDFQRIAGSSAQAMLDVLHDLDVVRTVG